MFALKKRTLTEEKRKVYDVQSAHRKNINRIKEIMNEVSKPVDNIRRPVPLLKQLGR